MKRHSTLLRYLLVFPLLLVFLAISHAQEGKVYEFNDTAAIHIVTLKTGTVMRGKIIQIINKEKVIFQFLGEEIELDYKKIKKIEVTGPEEGSEVTRYQLFSSSNPSNSSYHNENVYFSPTAFTLKKREYEVQAQILALAGILSYEYGLGKGFSMKAAIAIPGLAMLQFKRSGPVAEKLHLGAGVTALAPFEDLNSTVLAGYGILTVGTEKNFFNLNLGVPYLTGEGPGGFFIGPSFSLALGNNFRIASEAYTWFSDGDSGLAYFIATAGYSKKRWGMDFGLWRVADFDVLTLPYLSFFYRL